MPLYTFYMNILDFSLDFFQLAKKCGLFCGLGWNNIIKSLTCAGRLINEGASLELPCLQVDKKYRPAPVPI